MRQTTPEQERTWTDPASWHLGGTVYASRADRRIFVPKRPPAQGQTFNFGRWRTWLFLLTLFSPLIAAVTAVIIGISTEVRPSAAARQIMDAHAPR